MRWESVVLSKKKKLNQRKYLSGGNRFIGSDEQYVEVQKGSK